MIRANSGVVLPDDGSFLVVPHDLPEGASPLREDDGINHQQREEQSSEHREPHAAQCPRRVADLGDGDPAQDRGRTKEQD